MQINSFLGGSHLLDHSFNQCKKQNNERVKKLSKELFPLTSEYRDSRGYSIQLWKTRQYGLVGAVYDPKGKLRIIPNHKIRNPLNDKQHPNELMLSLETSPNITWDLAYDINQLTLTIWPHMVAAGKQPDMRSKLSQLQNAQTNAATTKTLPDGRQRYYSTVTPAGNKDPSNRTAGGRAMVTEFNPKTLTTRSWAECYDHTGKVSQVHPKQINGVDVDKPHYPPTAKDLAKKDPDGGGGGGKGGGGGGSGGAGPGNKNFQQSLQQTRLTDSYNSTHRGNPVAPKGARGGDIGGVACSTDFIEGLFDTPEALFETEHYFCVPGLPDGKMPFSDGELRQILRELATGIYVHSTIPFFSLHFNQNADMYPVIHPAYENTLVGRVISMLDYIMKGYLNGGVFKENFVDEWHKDPKWNKNKEATALQQLIDFTEHCKNLPGDNGQYFSLRMLQSEMDVLKKSPDLAEKAAEKLGEMLGMIKQESDALKNFTGFSNSFRIIAKQKSIQKEGNLFLIDSDFDVKYTINPSPAYKAALDEHLRKYGSLPISYVKLEQSYKTFCKRIHDHMSKIPLCRNYFAMLSVINFFSGYFSTMKKYRKVPVLSAIKPKTDAGCPPLFPHLPINAVIVETLKLNLHGALTSVISQYNSKFQSYFTQNYKAKLDGKPINEAAERNELIHLLAKEITDNLLTNANLSIRRILKPKLNSPELQETILETASDILKGLDKSIDGIIQLLGNNFVNDIPKMFDEERILNIINPFIQQESNALIHYLQLLQKDHLDSTQTAYYTQRNNVLERLKTQVRLHTPGLHLAEYRITEFANIILGHIETNLKNTLVNLTSSFVTTFPKIIPNQIEDFAKITLNAPRVGTEMQPHEIENGKRVVGGCGMKLEQLAVQTSVVAGNILRKNWYTFQQIKPETWTEVPFGMGNKKGYAFRLDFEEVPAEIQDDYAWMESLLIIPKGVKEDTIETRLQIQSCMASGQKQEFAKLVNENAKELLHMVDVQERNLMHIAATQTDPYYVKTLVSAGLSVCGEDSQGYHPIHYAAMKGAIDTVQELLKHWNLNDIINLPSKNLSTPLIVAIQNDQVLMVKFLLSKGALPNRLANGYNTLHCGLHYGNMDVINELLSNQKVVANCLDELSEEGGTPLMLACELDSAPLVTKMLSLNADPNIARKDDVTALEVALRRNCLPVVQALLTKTVPTSQALEGAAKEGSIEILSLLATQSYFYTHKNSYDDTALHTAIRFGNINGALLIVRQCKDVNYLKAVNQGKETPFSLAASLGLWEMIEELFNKGAADLSQACLNMLLRIEYNPILKTIFHQSHFNQTQLNDFALVAAQAGNHLALSFIFIPKKVKLETLIGPKEWRIPHYLAKCDGIMLFRNMVTKEKNLLQPLKKDGNRTLPYIAATHKSLRVLKFCLEIMKKEKVSLDKHFNDKHLLYAAVESADLETVELFLDIYQENQPELVNIPLDNSAIRALHLAAKMGSLPLVKLFIQRGAIVHTLDKLGYNVLTYALKLGHEDIVVYLLNEFPDLVNGLSVFMAAAQDDEDLYEKVIKLCRDPNILAEALFISVQARHLKAFFKLYKNHAPLNFISKTGDTILSLASETGQSNILNAILKDPRIKDVPAKNALELALKNKFVQCALMLLDASFKLTKKDNAFIEEQVKTNSWFKMFSDKRASLQERISVFANHLSQNELDYIKIVPLILKWPLNEIIQIEYEDKLIWGTPFQLLLKVGGKEIKKGLITQILQKKDINPNLRDSDGNTLAHLLLQANISPLIWKNVDLSIFNHEGQTPFHIAALFASPIILKELFATKNALQFLEAQDIHGRTPIYYAIQKHDENNVDELIKLGANLNIYDDKLATPLLLALIPPPSLSIVKKLLQAQANPNQFGTPQHIFPIHLSFQFERDELTRCLLMFGANCNVRSSDKVSLNHVAAQSGRTHLLNLFTTKGLSLVEADARGKLPIHDAAAQGRVETVKAILSLQEDAINAPVVIPDDIAKKDRLPSGITSVHLASAYNQTETLQFLLNKGAQTDSSDKEKTLSPLAFSAATASKSTLDQFSPYKVSHNPEALCRAVEMAIIHDNLDAVIHFYKRGIPINAELSNGFTGLQLAALKGSILTTQWLLMNKADAFHPSPTGEDSLQLSASNHSVQQFALILKFVEPDLDELRGHKETLLHTAVRAGKMNHVMYLLKNYAYLDTKDSKGNTPLHTAIQYKRDQIAALLLACGADATLKTGIGKTILELVDEDDKMTRRVIQEYSILLEMSAKMKDFPIHLAIRSRNPLALLLAPYLGDLNQLNGEGYSPLHLAAEMGQLDACMTLLQAGANIDILDSLSQTPLKLACMTNFETAEFLIQSRANKTIQDKRGMTALAAINASNLPWKEKLAKLLT